MLPFTLTALTLTLLPMASAHAMLYGVAVNSQPLLDGRNKSIRTPLSNSPVKDLVSPDLVCNTRGGVPVPEFVKANAGDTLTFRWFHWNPDDPNDILDPSHKGAILTYIAEYTEGDGRGPRWTKIHQEGFDGGEWATIKMRNNGGRVQVKLPRNLAPGRYLVRQELLALHMADFRGDDPEHPGRGAESYPDCVQVEVGGNGKARPDQGFDFNKGYTYEDKGLFFNIYIPFEKYTPPGPVVWTGE